MFSNIICHRNSRPSRRVHPANRLSCFAARHACPRYRICSVVAQTHQFGFPTNEFYRNSHLSDRSHTSVWTEVLQPRIACLTQIAIQTTPTLLKKLQNDIYDLCLFSYSFKIFIKNIGGIWHIVFSIVCIFEPLLNEQRNLIGQSIIQSL